MTQMPGSLEQLMAELTPLDGEFSPVLRISRLADTGLILTDLDDQTVRRLMVDVLVEEPQGDAKLAAAYLMGNVAWSLCEVLTGLALRGHWLAAARPSAIRLNQRFVHWEEEGEKGVSLVFDVAIEPADAALVALEAAPGLATTLQEQLAPFVDTLHSLSGLGRTALWRLVADSMAAAFLEHGKARGCADQAMGYATAILDDPDTKLANQQTGFNWIDVPENPALGAWMRVRGGCCRAYTAPSGSGDYCTTCVLRTAESRRARYRTYLRNKHSTIPAV